MAFWNCLPASACTTQKHSQACDVKSDDERLDLFTRKYFLKMTHLNTIFRKNLGAQHTGLALVMQNLEGRGISRFESQGL